MKRLIYIVGCLTCLLTACGKEELGESLIDTSTPVLNETDKWIRQNYTTPLNVEVKYKWDLSELDQSKVLTPAKLENVQPFLLELKKIWIDPYVKNGGADFMKKYMPKLIVLVGSRNFNYDGSIVLGQAESGRKVTIFDLNYITFDFTGMNDWDKETVINTVARTMRTMHHEFGHILHQTVAYPVEYKKITTNYTSSWMNYNDSEARRMGFISAYSMLNPNEDFVEMLSTFLTMSNANWNKLVNNIVVYDKDDNEDAEASEKARSLIRAKEKFIADYMQQVWKINFYDLQADISKGMDELRSGKF
jgi:substrate import-associated zinc metallohydrolase lipoprotein